MASDYKNTDLLKYLPFYTSEIQKSIKKPRIKKEVIKQPKISNKELSQALPFHPKKTKKLIKRQILENILPFFEDVGITITERAFRESAETNNVELNDNIGLRDSLYLAKRSIINFLKDKLQEKRGFKYSILPIVTIKKWKAEINAWEFQNICIRSDTITVTNQRFYLNDAFTKILNLLDAWEVEGSGWVIEQVQDIHININNYDPLARSSYIPLPRQLQNLMHGLINIKNTGKKKVTGKMKDVKPS